MWLLLEKVPLGFLLRYAWGMYNGCHSGALSGRANKSRVKGQNCPMNSDTCPEETQSQS